MDRGEFAYLPEAWVVSYKHDCLPWWPSNFWAQPRLPEGARVVIETSDGRTVSGVLEEPTGMPGNPLSDEQIDGKFMACCAFAGLEDARARERLERLWAIEEQGVLTGL